VVHDNPALGRFELEVNGRTAFAAYRRSPGRITFTHTEVPEELEGQGVGAELVRGALDAVRATDEKVVALCPFVAAFIKRHPDYQDLLAR